MTKARTLGHAPFFAFSGGTSVRPAAQDSETKKHRLLLG